VLGLLLTTAVPAGAWPSYHEIFELIRPRTVKIYGAGGLRGLEAYQSGFLISADGYILTTWSYVLDTDYVSVVLDDGRKFEQAKLVGADPRTEIAILKIEAADLPYFDLSEAVKAEPGTKVLAFTTIDGVASGNEPFSVQHGVVSVRAPLAGRRGSYETRYKGDVYVIDAITNNPGGGGGVLTNRRGELLGMVGKELRNSQNNTWLNFAIPIDQLSKTVDDILKGTFVPAETNPTAERPPYPLNSELLGLVLVPDVLERTPPFIDFVRPQSAAAKAGLRPDDLILFVNDRLIQSCKLLRAELDQIDRAQPIRLTVMRQQELIEVELTALPGPARNMP